jgi:hypothetical protein
MVVVAKLVFGEPECYRLGIDEQQNSHIITASCT